MMGSMHAHKIVTEMKTVRKMNQSKLKKNDLFSGLGPSNSNNNKSHRK